MVQAAHSLIDPSFGSLLEKYTSFHQLVATVRTRFYSLMIGHDLAVFFWRESGPKSMNLSSSRCHQIGFSVSRHFGLARRRNPIS